MTEKNRIRGKKARASGQKFELVVRKDLESKGWIVIKNPNNVFFEEENVGAFKSSKPKFNPFTKSIQMMGGGFPDFIAINKDRYNIGTSDEHKIVNEVMGVEVKSNGYLDAIEKEKCKWLLDNHIFSKILIARKNKKEGGIEYV